MAEKETAENKKVSTRTRKPAEKKTATESKVSANNKNDNNSKDNEAKKRVKPKRDKAYTFYCTEAELQELERRAEKKYLTLAEYFRIKVFADD